MKQTETITSFSCDICGSQNITPQTMRHRETMGFRLGSAIGIEIHLKAFGSYTEHICEMCAQKAMVSAFHSEMESAFSKEMISAVNYEFGNVRCEKCGGKLPVTELNDATGECTCEH